MFIALAHSKVQVHFFATFLKFFAFFDLTISTILKLLSFTLPIFDIFHSFYTSQPRTTPSGKISTSLPPAKQGE